MGAGGSWAPRGWQGWHWGWGSAATGDPPAGHGVVGDSWAAVGRVVLGWWGGGSQLLGTLTPSGTPTPVRGLGTPTPSRHPDCPLSTPTLVRAPGTPNPPEHHKPRGGDRAPRAPLGSPNLPRHPHPSRARGCPKTPGRPPTPGVLQEQWGWGAPGRGPLAVPPRRGCQAWPLLGSPERLAQPAARGGPSAPPRFSTCGGTGGESPGRAGPGPTAGPRRALPVPRGSAGRWEGTELATPPGPTGRDPPVAPGREGRSRPRRGAAGTRPPPSAGLNASGTPRLPPRGVRPITRAAQFLASSHCLLCLSIKMAATNREAEFGWLPPTGKSASSASKACQSINERRRAHVDPISQARCQSEI